MRTTGRTVEPSKRRTVEPKFLNGFKNMKAAYRQQQVTISAVWLAGNMSINPKSVNSAISQVQKSEIECKTVKLSAKQWNWVQNGEIKSDWQLRRNWATTNKMADKNETKIETLHLNSTTKTS